ncbi:DLG1 protein, partial [Leiothrix lutea]|nr:DLG1 protein [Leiothrix lutea]
DTERAVEILTRYQSTLRSPEEQELKASIGKVSHIFQSELFQALLGKPLPCSPLQSLAALCLVGSPGSLVPHWCLALTSAFCGNTVHDSSWDREQRLTTGAGDSTPGTPPRLVRVTARRTEAPASVCSLVLSSHSTLPQVSL